MMPQKQDCDCSETGLWHWGKSCEFLETGCLTLQTFSQDSWMQGTDMKNELAVQEWATQKLLLELYFKPLCVEQS